MELEKRIIHCIELKKCTEIYTGSFEVTIYTQETFEYSSAPQS